MENICCDPQQVLEYSNLDDAKDAYPLTTIKCYELSSVSESHNLHGFAYGIKESNSFNCGI